MMTIETALVKWIEIEANQSINMAMIRPKGKAFSIAKRVVPGLSSLKNDKKVVSISNYRNIEDKRIDANKNAVKQLGKLRWELKKIGEMNIKTKVITTV
jgi:ribosomal protein S13